MATVGFDLRNDYDPESFNWDMYRGFIVDFMVG